MVKVSLFCEIFKIYSCYHRQVFLLCLSIYLTKINSFFNSILSEYLFYFWKFKHITGANTFAKLSKFIVISSLEKSAKTVYIFKALLPLIQNSVNFAFFNHSNFSHILRLNIEKIAVQNKWHYTPLEIQRVYSPCK